MLINFEAMDMHAPSICRSWKSIKLLSPSVRKVEGKRNLRPHPSTPRPSSLVRRGWLLAIWFTSPRNDKDFSGPCSFSLSFSQGVLIDRGDVTEWSRRSAHDNEVVGSNLVGKTFHKPTVHSNFHSSEASKWIPRVFVLEYQSEGTSCSITSARLVPEPPTK